FMIREQKRRAELLSSIASLLLENDEPISILRDPKLPGLLYLKITSRKKTPSYRSYVFYDNIFRNVRNLLKNELKKTITTDPNVQLSYPANLPSYFDAFCQLHMKQFCTTLLRILGKRVKAISKGNGPPLGKSKFDSVLLEQFHDSVITPNGWKKLRAKWRNTLLSFLQSKLAMIDTEDFFSKVSSAFQNRMNPSYLVNLLFRKKMSHSYIKNADGEGFMEYLKECAVLEQEFQYLESKMDTYASEVQSILSSISRYPLEFLGKPHFKCTTIPLGADDGQVYSLTVECNDNPELITQVNVCLSFQSRITYKFLLNDTERFNALITNGYKPKRGTIAKGFGKGLILAIPFHKYITSDMNVSTQTDGCETVASVDLGLKTLATMSIGQIYRNEDRCIRENRNEFARYFIDQEELIGSKEEWLTRKKDTLLSGNDNVKRHLLNLRMQARHLQKKIDTYTNNYTIKYRHKVKFRILHTQWKYIWKKIRNIHKELANQIATRIVAAVLFHEAYIIKVENLSWSKPRSKQQVGYFLSTWQVHWFFSQVQSKIECIARKYGIHVVYVNAHNTSQRCSRCGVVGKRYRKRFTCPNCGFSLDSDLNASREIAVADLSPLATCIRGGSPLPSPQ
ncbi:MAG: zinc ribbon domain-containing protein, partial [Promethearchaeota archaeon]